MRVSIVIPTFNRANYLEEAISSALAQDYENLEVIVSDNASTDNTEQVAKLFLKNPRMRYFRNLENIGMVPNWYEAVFKRSTGDWFILLSDDDILINPHFVSSAMRLIQSSPDVRVVYSSSYVYDQGLNTVAPINIPFRSIEDGKLVFSKRGTVHPQDFALCNILFNKNLAIECGAFKNSNNLSCDTELFLRLCLLGKVGVVKEYSSVYRVHSENLLKSVNKNTDLIQGSLDSLLKPLLEAKKQGIDAHFIRDFIVNSRLKREIFVCLLKISSNSKMRADELYKRLSVLLADISYGVLPNKLLFRLIQLTAGALMPLLGWRRRALFMLNAMKRHVFGRQKYFRALNRKVYFID